jgi:poly-beta-1,6-N-acetyl-D-glucosamine synthase
LTITLLNWVTLWVCLTMLLYAHVVYPALMAFVARRTSSVPELSQWPSVSLIIPAHNESLVIRAKIENSLAIDYPADLLEVIVASDGSTDGTVGLARTFEDSGVRVLELTPRRGKASVLNDAVASSHGEVLCLCDANVMFRPDALRKMIAHLADPAIGAVTGDVRLASDQSDFGEGESAYYRLERAVQLGESRCGSLICVDGGMYVLRRGLYRQLPADTVLDDFSTTMNVVMQSSRVIYEPAAIADENGTPQWQQEFRRRVRTTVGAVQSIRRGYWPGLRQPVVLWQYASHKLLRWLGPFWMIGLLVTSCLLWSHSPFMPAFVAFQLSLYLLAVMAIPLRTLRESRFGGVAFYFAMSHVAMLVGVVKAFSTSARGTWERTERQVSRADAIRTAASTSPR